ncbi:MAG: YihY/virulence factor BrkB family protein [Desulfuromonadaceae bacterium]|nr:YihY/virulence factor BrkB family protein [Desulfuromonadaceae bacterium]
MKTKITGKTSGKGTIWELTGRVARGALKDNCDGYAAQIAFFFLFALFPCLLTLTTLLAYLPVPDLFRMLMRIMERFVPENVLFLVEENLRTLVSVQQGGLLSIGVLLSLWTSSNAVIAVQIALNEAYGTEEQRPYWKVRVISVLLVICFTSFIILSLLLLVFGPHIGDWIATLAGLGDTFTLAWNILRWPVIIWLMMSALSALYRYAPAIKHSWMETAPGAVAATGAWVAVSLIFSYFVNNFDSYDKTYGSIGAVIALLVWMYASGLVILIGGEINVRLRELTGEKNEEIYNEGGGQMRKSLITTEIKKDVLPGLNWLDLLRIARAELSSEDPQHPIESALNLAGGSGWRALEPGRQTIRLLFDEPLEIRRVQLLIQEDEQQRAQEFVLRWSPDDGRSYREIARQQFNFTPPETTRETEEYTVDLAGVTALELVILPDIGGANVRASLSSLRLA